MGWAALANACAHPALSGRAKELLTHPVLLGRAKELRVRENLDYIVEGADMAKVAVARLGLIFDESVPPSGDAWSMFRLYGVTFGEARDEGTLKFSVSSGKSSHR